MGIKPNELAQKGGDLTKHKSDSALEWQALDLIIKADEHFRRTEEDLDPMSFDNGEIGAQQKVLRLAIDRVQRHVKFVDIEEVRAAIATAQSRNIIPSLRMYGSSSEQNSHTLTPEQVEVTLRILKHRFNSREGLKRHKGVEWGRVENALLKNPEALWSIRAMEAAEHQPDVYFSDKNGFDIGTCSEEAPDQGTNCIYDEEGAETYRKIYLDIPLKGSAKGMAKIFGIKLMSPEQYKSLQQNGEFDFNGKIWLETDPYTRKHGLAYEGYRYADVIVICGRSAFLPSESRSWRGTLRVNWAD